MEIKLELKHQYKGGKSNNESIFNKTFFWKPFKSKISSGWLRRYTAFAKSANVGGTLMSDEEFEERKAERQAQEKN